MGQPNGYSAVSGHRPDTPARAVTPPMRRRGAIIPPSSSSDESSSAGDSTRQTLDPFLDRLDRQEEPERHLEDYPHAVYGLTANPEPGGWGKLELLGVFEDEAYAEDEAMAFEPVNATLDRMFVIEHSADHGLRSVWIWHDEAGTMHMSMTVRRPISDWRGADPDGDEYADGEQHADRDGLENGIEDEDMQDA